MKPQVVRVNLYEFPLNAQKRICGCNETCKTGISFTTYNDGMILCSNDARVFLDDIKEALGDKKKRVFWPPEEEQFIIDYLKKHGKYYGHTRDIATALNRTFKQVQTKIKRMKKKGEL